MSVVPMSARYSSTIISDHKHHYGIHDNIQVLPWTSGTPDLNIVEYLWDELDRRVRQRHPQSLSQRVLQAEWAIIPQGPNSTLIAIMVMRFFYFQGQGAPCDQFTCAEFATCTNGECICSTGYVGSGRFLCVPVGQCGCVSFGDPHTRQFDLGNTRTVLPCQFNLAGFTTASGCDIRVETVTKLRNNPQFPFRIFNRELLVTASRDNTVVTFTLGPGGQSTPVVAAIPGVIDAIPGLLDVVVTPSQFNGFYRATLLPCDTVIAYDPALMAATVSTLPTATFTNAGFCANCNGNRADDNEFLVVPGVTPVEADLGLSLRELTINQGTPDAAVCTDLKAIANTPACMVDAFLVNAIKCCSIFYDSAYAGCLLNNVAIPQTRASLLETYKNCMLQYCINNIPGAAAIAPFFAPSGCQGAPCGQFTCAEFATCTNEECICSTGYVGSGRFLCVPVGQCGCVSFGDPHTRQFDLGNTRTVLPCQFNLAGFTTASGCDIRVETVTKLRNNPQFPFRIFNRELLVTASRDNTVVTLTLGPGGQSTPVVAAIPGVIDAIPGLLDVVVTPSQFNGFYRATLLPCDTVIAYDPALMAATVSTLPTSTFTNAGFCANCNGNRADDNEFLVVPGVTPVEADLGLSLRELTINQGTPDAAVCTDLKAIANTPACMVDAFLVNAIKCCSIFYDSAYAGCLLNNVAIPQTRASLLETFKNCMLQYCINNIPAAAAIAPFFAPSGCALPVGYTCPA
ncbi:uncharacterized protein LOC124126576 [Haliotis rufescens]|uniref:uncharacterized protein LOC124126576 n=1 Tax=Haliotis rufescens TaxID=6454 RepID=UPI00201F360D|nr:uncharacterized protein LOC124126576 [Haliotis rufescens]